MILIWLGKVLFKHIDNSLLNYSREDFPQILAMLKRTKIRQNFKKLYDLLIFRYPSIFLIIASLYLQVLSYHAKDIQIDASAETLLFRDDEI